MYEDSGYFNLSHDLTPVPPPLIDSSSHIPDYSSFSNNGLEDNLQLDLEDPTASVILDHIHLHDNNHHQLGFDLMQEDINGAPQMETAANWESTSHQMYTEAPSYGPAPDLLNLLQLPRCTAGLASIPFDNSRPANIWADEGSVFYDPSVHMGYVGAQPNVFRDMCQSFPQSYGLFCGLEEREGAMGGVGVGGVFQEMMDGRQFDGGVMDYRRGNLGKGEVKGNFATERQRREQLNGKYSALRSLVPNPTKNDRASVVGDAIEYIKELLRTVDELKIVLEKKKHGSERRKILKADVEAAGDMESSLRRPLRDEDCLPNGALRCSWLQRKSKESSVDVRIIDNEVNIKLNQRKKPNCVAYIAKALEELQLDLVHLAGGNIGDSYVFMLNAMICEGSSVYASAIAQKLLEVMDIQYPTLTYPANY